VAEVLVRFAGPVSWERAAPPLGLSLRGATRAHPAEPSTLCFVAPGPVTLPQALSDAEVERLAPGEYCIRAAGAEYRLAARGAHLYRDAAAPFYRALPPRPAPAGRRLLWRLALALAASRAGLALLRALRR
jgi:hypothetical protein